MGTASRAATAYQLPHGCGLASCDLCAQDDADPPVVILAHLPPERPVERGSVRVAGTVAPPEDDPRFASTLWCY